jgi:hypothetical protein
MIVLILWLTIKTYLKSQYNIQQDWYFVVADEKLISLKYMK